MRCASRSRSRCSGSLNRRWDSVNFPCAASIACAANGASLPWPGTSGGSSPSSRPDTADAPRPSGREGPGNADIRPFNRFLRPIQRQASPQPAKIILGNQPRPQSDRLLAHHPRDGFMTETRKLAAILAADMVGFSRLASLDEERTLMRLRALNGDLIDPAVAAHHGRIVKRTGDGILVEFRSVVDAVRCAVEVQEGLIERNVGLSPDRRIEFRIGVHIGDVAEE